MATVQKALLARLEAKPGREADVAQLLKSAEALARAEEKTVTWYAFQLDASTFGIFDTFEGEPGREAHLNGDIAAALMDKTDELLTSPPQIDKADVLAVK